MSELSAEFLALQSYLAGRYSIEYELGRGGMGIVLLARDVALDRLVSIKMLPPELAQNHEQRQRLLREARIAAGLSHPNIVPIHLVEEHENLVFFVMGYVDGQTLRERVERNGPLTPRAAMKLMQEVAWALAYAHERGIVHRDIKPDNIMIDQATDRAMVTDFGIAHVATPDSGTSGTEVMGTARFMSPEQACGEDVDPRSDLYSLGATFFYALTGRAPFEASNLPAIITKHVTEPAPSVRALRPDVPERLANIIDRCLEKDPGDRLQSGSETAQAVSETRGRDYRAPPLVRGFVRNAEVTTMVVLAVALAGQTATVGGGGFNISLGGPGIIGSILIVQLIIVARRLLREGYTFDDIRAALLAEAAVQDEEAAVSLDRRWMRRLNSLWQRVWAGKFGRWFFRVAGTGMRKPRHAIVPSTDPTELVLGRSVMDTFYTLPASQQGRIGPLPQVVGHLEERAERLRDHGDRTQELVDTVAALEKVRLVLLRFQAGEASLQDLTLELQRAREVGEAVDRMVASRQEVEEALGERPPTPR